MWELLKPPQTLVWGEFLCDANDLETNPDTCHHLPAEKPGDGIIDMAEFVRLLEHPQLQANLGGFQQLCCFFLGGGSVEQC